MGLLRKLSGTLRRLFGGGGESPRGGDLGANVVSLAASKKDRARAAEKQRRAQAEADRQKRWSAPSNGKK